MLDYEWGTNPSSIMLSADQETSQVSEPTLPVFNPFSTQNFSQPSNFINQQPYFPTFQPLETLNSTTHFPTFCDSRANNTTPYSHPHAQMLAFEPARSNGFMMVPKHEPFVGFNTDFNSRIGLNLGGRTYFASSEDDFVNRLYCRSRLLDSGLMNLPRCQAEGCSADLTNAKHYHRRHKVCELHSKASTVITAGLTQRFCQQCSRFHVLTEFDNGKRSCRKRLADHNRRRRKSQQNNQQNGDNSTQLEDNAPSNFSRETLARSPPESDPHQPSSVVTLAISPPRISLEYCKSNNYNMGMNSTLTGSTSSFFYPYE